MLTARTRNKRKNSRLITIITMFKGDYTRDDSQRRVLALQHCCDIVSTLSHNIAPALLRHCFDIVSQHCSSVVATLFRMVTTLLQHCCDIVSNGHNIAPALLRHCFEWSQHCSSIATLCCAKRRVKVVAANRSV